MFKRTLLIEVISRGLSLGLHDTLATSGDTYEPVSKATQIIYDICESYNKNWLIRPTNFRVKKSTDEYSMLVEIVGPTRNVKNVLSDIKNNRALNDSFIIQVY
jgi:hypothetical protein